MTIFLCLLCAFQEPSVDDLLRDLSHETVQVREKATRRLADRWKEWKEDDLQKIVRAADGTDAETAARSRIALEEITLWRRFSDALFTAVPDLIPTFRAGTADQARRMIVRIKIQLAKKKLSKLDVVPVFIEFLEDARETSEYAESFGPRDTRLITVGELARQALLWQVGRPILSSREEWRAWWAENGRKPEKEWYLPDLTSVHEHIRSEAINRVAQLKDPSLHPPMFAALRSIRDNLRLAAAIGSLAELSKEILLRELRPYLSDRLPYGRLAAARLLFSEVPDEAVASVLQSLEKTEEMDLNGLDVETFRSGYNTVDWLASTNHPQANEFLARALKTGSASLKTQVLDGFERYQAPEQLDVLADALADPLELGMTGTTHGAAVCNPRAGDLAGIMLADRLAVRPPYDWLVSKRLRDANLAVIRNAWREKKGFPILSLPSQEPEPVDRRRVAPLFEAIQTNDEQRRAKATEDLCRLGAGAWAPFQAEWRTTGGFRMHWMSAALSFMRTLRSVEAKEGADELARPLKERLHTPLRIEDLEALGAAWYRDPRLTEIDLEIERDRWGRGVFVVLRVRKGNPPMAAHSITFRTRQSTGVMLAEDKLFSQTWREQFLDPFWEGIEKDSAEYIYQSVRMVKVAK